MKIFIWISSLVFLVSSTELIQFLRIPALITHYKEHKEDNKKLDFIKFLSLHYSNDTSDGESQEHHHLPFKSANLTCLMTVPAVTFSIDFCIPPVPSISLIRIYYNGNVDAPKSSNITAIWQPPKFC